jgi:hemoglobin
MTYFEQIGGDLKLLAIIDDFVERVCADTMIGFFFSRVDRARLKRLEYEHAAHFLGADIAYTGRALNDAHRRHPILGGHFARRRQILKQTLERHGVPPVILEAWLAHQDALKAEVTPDDVTQCNDVRVHAREQKPDVREPVRTQERDERQPAPEQERDERPPTSGTDEEPR